MLSDWIDRMHVLHFHGLRPARNRLQTYFGDFCPVGVLCDVVDDASWSPSAPYTWHGAKIGWPQGMPLPDGVTPDHMRVAMDMSVQGSTFAEIADALESVG